MSTSEFRYNKKRKHYAYLFKELGPKRKNIVLTSKSFRRIKNRIKKNIKLYKHPNSKSNKPAFVVPYVYIDDLLSFDEKILNWRFHPHGKRKIKRIKKRHIKIKKPVSKSRL